MSDRLQVDSFGLDYSERSARLSLWKKGGEDECRSIVSIVVPTASITSQTDSQLRIGAVSAVKRTLQEALAVLEAHPW